MSGEPTEEDTFKILVATDTHLGYNEKDPIRGDDSFIAFEETLQHAVNNQVDFILLGGDLFHDNKPSSTAIERCLTLLRKYCLGDKPVSVEFLSNPEESFSHLPNPMINWEDPNLNVAYPVFTIHGNHDDPSGPKMQCALDLLSSVGLINHFGKWTDFSHVELKPMLLKKGESRLALYGLGHIKDQRLARLVRDHKVSYFRPSDEDEDWFNLLVLHQNRVHRSTNNFFPEAALPKFLDLVVWGHEHDCRIEPEITVNDVYITQPGSSVATSLSEGEAIPKRVGLLRVYKKKLHMQPIPLGTVRPFIFETLSLSETLSEADLNLEDDQVSKKVETYAENRIEEMLDKAQELLSGKPEQPELPLIRLRIEFDNQNQLFNLVRFGQKFDGRVANPSDLVLMRKKTTEAKAKRENLLDSETFAEALDRVKTRGEVTIYSIIDEYFANLKQKDPSLCMQMLSSNGLIEAARRFVRKNDKDALECIIEHQSERTMEYMKTINDENYEENFHMHLANFRAARAARAEEEEREINKMLDESRVVKLTASGTASANGNVTRRAPRGRGGPGSRGGRVRKVAVEDEEGDSDDGVLEIQDSDEDVPPAPTTGRGARARGTARATRAARAPRRAAAAPRGRGRATAVADTSGASDQSFAAIFNSSRKTGRK